MSKSMKPSTPSETEKQEAYNALVRIAKDYKLGWQYKNYSQLENAVKELRASCRRMPSMEGILLFTHHNTIVHITKPNAGEIEIAYSAKVGLAINGTIKSDHADLLFQLFKALDW